MRRTHRPRPARPHRPAPAPSHLRCRRTCAALGLRSQSGPSDSHSRTRSVPAATLLAMNGLRSIGRRELTRRKVRYALTALGIVLGVANIFGVLVTNGSTNRAIRQQSEAFTISQVFANPRGKSFDAETLDRLAKLPEVRAVSIFDSVELP